MHVSSKVSRSCPQHLLLPPWPELDPRAKLSCKGDWEMRSLSWQPCAQLSQGLYYYGRAREQMLEDVLAKEHRGLAASGPAYPLLPRRRTAGREQVCWCLPTAWRLGEGSGSGCQGGETEAEVQS